MLEPQTNTVIKESTESIYPLPASLPPYRFGAANPTLIGRRPMPAMCCISTRAFCWSLSSENLTKPKPLLLPVLSRTTEIKQKKNCKTCSEALVD